MSIQFSQDDRDYLQQLAQRRMKPTSRQKAIALLRLAEGDTPERAAQRAGIKKEDVAELASKFSEHGLAGVGLKGKSVILVALVQPGVDIREYRLPKGGTVADLLSRSGASTTNQTILVDGGESEATLQLHEGAVVAIMPASGNGASDESQRANVPSLQDDDLFEQYREILKVRRKLRAQEEDSPE